MRLKVRRMMRLLVSAEESREVSTAAELVSPMTVAIMAG